MNSLEDLKIGKWYQAQNRIFMPIEKVYNTQISGAFGRDPTFIFNLVYLQPVEHLTIFSFEYRQWEVYIQEDRQYLYRVIAEDTIEIEDVKKPNLFNKVFIGLFDFEWQIVGSTDYLPVGSKRGIEELKDIINAIKEA